MTTQKQTNVQQPGYTAEETNKRNFGEVDLNKAGSDWVDVDGFHEFVEEGDCLVGQIIGQATFDSAASSSGVLSQTSFLTEDGITKVNLTSQLMILKRLPVGTTVRIEYNGEEPIGAKRVKKFRVRVLRSEFAGMAQGLVEAAKQGNLLPADPNADSFADE